jgi:hypothetical protein
MEEELRKSLPEHPNFKTGHREQIRPLHLATKGRMSMKMKHNLLPWCRTSQTRRSAVIVALQDNETNLPEYGAPGGVLTDLQ